MGRAAIKCTAAREVVFPYVAAFFADLRQIVRVFAWDCSEYNILPHVELVVQEM